MCRNKYNRILAHVGKKRKGKEENCGGYFFRKWDKVPARVKSLTKSSVNKGKKDEK